MTGLTPPRSVWLLAGLAETGESSVLRAFTLDAVVMIASCSDDASVCAISLSVGKCILSIEISSSLSAEVVSAGPSGVVMLMTLRRSVGGDGLKSERCTGIACSEWKPLPDEVDVPDPVAVVIVDKSFSSCVP